MNSNIDERLLGAIQNGHHRVSVSVGVNSPVATIETHDLLNLIHAAQGASRLLKAIENAGRLIDADAPGAARDVIRSALLREGRT